MKWPPRALLTLEARRKNLCRAISLSFDSLDTHLLHAVKAPKADYAGDEKFNAAAVREYAEIILICAVELEILAKKRKKKNEHPKSGKR